MSSIKHLLKAAVPRPMIRGLRTTLGITSQYFYRWQALRHLPWFAPTHGVPTSVLIIPSDPFSIVSSKGDDAMVTVVVEQVRTYNPDCRIGIVTFGPELPQKVKDWGLIPEPIWAGYSLDAFIAALARYEAVFVIGADVMDGHYSLADAVRYWSLADIAARCGRRSTVLGFSFKSSPPPAFKPVLDRIDRAVDICVRDEVSLTYFQEFTHAKARLVADIAFLLAPQSDSPDYNSIKRWTEDQRSKGRIICGINLHPMIYEEDVAAQSARLIRSAETALLDTAQHHAVSFLLIPHDFRGPLRGDDTILEPLYGLVRPVLGERVTYAQTACSAAQAKAIAKLADQLVTARMHLGIGALSLGVPIAGVTFQEKFKGLLGHFGIQSSLIISPEDALLPVRLAQLIKDSISTYKVNSSHVRRNLPKVMEMARSNFRSLNA
jgi:polysaccharide pyruvyl transferase WcaK-like protein